MWSRRMFSGQTALAERFHGKDRRRPNPCRRLVTPFKIPTRPLTLGVLAGGQPSPAAQKNVARQSASGKVPDRPAVDARVPADAPDPAVTEAATRVGKASKPDDIARQFRVDPTTGEYAEKAEFDQLVAEGRVTDEELASLAAADEDVATATAWGEALKTAMNCTI